MSNKPIAQQLSDDIGAVIDKYREQGITVCEVIGCLELNKEDIISENREVNGDDIFWN